MDNFLTPVLALIVWSLIIWCVMYARRIPAMSKAKIDVNDANHPNGAWKDKLPAKVEFAAHNYNHLMEQPTIFYALMFYMSLTGAATGDSLALTLAWSYVALRVVHSLVQISANKVMLRFGLFSLSTIILIVLAVKAVLHLL